MYPQASGNSQDEGLTLFDLRPFFRALDALAAFEGDDDDPEDDPDDLDGDDDKGTGAEDKEPVRDPAAKARSEEARKYRLRFRDERKRAEKLEAEVAELKAKDQDANERLSGEVESLRKQVADMTPRLKEQAVELAFFKSGVAAQFQAPSDALALLDLKDIDADDDGTVDPEDIKERAEALLKKSPYLAASGGNDGKDDEGDKDESKQQPSGRQTNGKKDKSEADFDALAKQFPALRR